MIRDQQRQVSKVLLDGLYDSDSPISKLLGVHTEVIGKIMEVIGEIMEVIGEIIWQKKLVWNWQIFPDPEDPA